MMEKPFDIKQLTADLAAQGLPMVEAAAEKAVETILNWVEASALIHPNVFVKAAVPLAVATIKPIVADALNKIDGQVG
jgi:acyl-homoserine lactone acylase PvdQ